MFSVQLLFGQSGAPGTGVVGDAVLTLKLRFPFLMLEDGSACAPLRVTSAGFWPGGWFAPEGFVHVATGWPVAVRAMTTSPFPSPASEPVALRNSPLSVKTGLPFLKCTLAAIADWAVIPTTDKHSTTRVAARRTMGSSFPWESP